MGYFGDLPNISFFSFFFFSLDFREARTVFWFFFYGLELEVSGGGGEENGREEK